MTSVEVRECAGGGERVMGATRVKARACETCLYLMDDHKCHRYPPSIPRYSVSYNLVTKYPLASRDGNAAVDFPVVDELMVCGEWEDRNSDEYLHVMTWNELVNKVLEVSE